MGDKIAMITSSMASPMLYRMKIVCTMIGAIHALSNTYWSKRSGDISQGPEVSTVIEENSIHPIERKKTNDLLEIIGNINVFLFQKLLTEKNLRRTNLLLEDLEKSLKGLKFQLKWKETQPIPSKTTDCIEMIENIHLFLFPQRLGEKKLRGKN